MPQTTYKISEARKHFAEVLDRANHGEEIIIMRGNEVYARIGPADGGKRPFGLLRQRGLPDDLFDAVDAEQAAIDAGDWNDDVGVWQGQSNEREPPNEGPARQPRRLLVDDRQRSPLHEGTIADRGQGQHDPRQRRLLYELDNKMRLKKLDLKPQELRAAVTASGLQTLAISDLHAELAASFDWDHRDPWDRLLAAQTRLEHCTFVSLDSAFDGVLHERVW